LDEDVKSLHITMGLDDKPFVSDGNNFIVYKYLILILTLLVAAVIDSLSKCVHVVEHREVIKTHLPNKVNKKELHYCSPF
jgi:hypothetical protein